MGRTIGRMGVALALALPGAALAEGRIAVMSAFDPEWLLLKAEVAGAETQTINGTQFVTGTLAGQDVVLFLSGISMVNAAMTTQLALERFEVDAIVFSGIAGGVDPVLTIGDVVIAEAWGQYLDVILARDTGEGWQIPSWMRSDFDNYGMIHTRNQTVARDGLEAPETRFWFPVDADLLAAARDLAEGLELSACNTDDACLSEPPQIVVGGNGVSGSAFVDNAAFREWTFATFDARVLDMESAAVAHVAHANGVPFIAFRSLSDLAGGGEDANELPLFFSLAADNAARVVMAYLAALD